MWIMTINVENHTAATGYEMFFCFIRPHFEHFESRITFADATHPNDTRSEPSRRSRLYRDRAGRQNDVYNTCTTAA